jgi:uncharacterized protein YgiM (DUF1202 family)
MRVRGSLRWVLLFLLALPLIFACGAPQATYTPAPLVYYYVLPTSTYLRDCPGYECGVVSMVYSGERVELQERDAYGWSRVRLVDRLGSGWIPSDLLSLSPVGATYYVAMNTVYLRECADYNCRALQLLHRGDQVEKIDQNNAGWWRVTALKTRTTGWLPASAVSARPGPPFYYVAVNSLALRSGPGTSKKMLTTLGLNAQVELLSMGAGGWAEVRDSRSGTIGWVAFRYLESFPVSHARPVPSTSKRKPPSKGAPEKPEEAPKALPKAM